MGACVAELRGLRGRVVGGEDRGVKVIGIEPCGH